MNQEQWVALLKEAWYLVVILIVCLAVVIFKYTQGEPQVVESPTPIAQAAASEDTVRGSGLSPDEGQQNAQRIIDDHQAKYDADRSSPEAPVRLFAMGNLYRQKLMQYGEAARCYELILAKYPEWEGIAQVYPQLVACYKQTKDQDNEMYTYKRMMERFAPDTQEYKFAEAQLAP